MFRSSGTKQTCGGQPTPQHCHPSYPEPTGISTCAAGAEEKDGASRLGGRDVTADLGPSKLEFCEEQGQPQGPITLAAELEKLLPTLPPDVAQRAQQTMQAPSAGQSVGWSPVGDVLVILASCGEVHEMTKLVSAHSEYNTPTDVTWGINQLLADWLACG